MICLLNEWDFYSACPSEQYPICYPPMSVDRRHLEEGKQPAQGTSNVLARVSEVKMSPVAD